MRGSFSPWHRGTLGGVVALALLAAAPAAAQSVPVDVDDTPIVASTPFVVSASANDIASRPLIADVVTRVAKDPTTYALPFIVYTTHRLDWDSSQKLFAYGYFEGNPHMTVSGLVNTPPVSHAEGNRRILKYSASTIGRSILNNAASAIVERRLIERAPEHRKLIRALGWVERSLVTSYWSYRLTHNQVAQWRANEQLAGQIQAFQSTPLAALP